METLGRQFVGESDSDDSFLFQNQLRKQSTAIGSQRVHMQGLSRKHAKRGTPDRDQVGKENCDDQRYSASNNRKVFLKPPPKSWNSDNLYCSQILQQKRQNHNDGKSAITIHEYTCECCKYLQEHAKNVNTSNATESPKMPRAIVVDDLDEKQCENDDEEVLSAAILSDSSTIDDLDDSIEVEDKPIKHPPRSLSDKITRKQYIIREDDSTECSFVVQSSEESSGDGSRSDVERKIPTPKERPKKVDALEIKKGEKLDSHDKQDDSTIPSKIVVTKNAPQPSVDDEKELADDKEKKLSPNPKNEDKKLSSQIRSDLVDLIGSDASSYSGSDNSFLDRKPIPQPKVAVSQRPSLRNKIRAKSASIWNSSFDCSSDSDVEIYSSTRRQRIKEGKKKDRAGPTRRPVILESSSEGGGSDWEVAVNDNCSLETDDSLKELMKQMGFQDKRKKQKKKYPSPKKKKAIHKSMSVEDDSTFEARRAINKDGPIKAKKPMKKPRAKASSSKLLEEKPVEEPQMKTSLRYFKLNREALAIDLFGEYDRKAFDGKLASVELVWSNKLQTTAGLTRLISKTMFGKVDREAKIELALKIIDDMDRLRSTLLHEMCHAAQWLVDGVAKPAHGKCFQKWSKKAMSKVPGVVVTTTHTYEISYKYAWACTTNGCKVVIKRQSKSVDVTKQCCAKCKGKLVEIEVPKKGKFSISDGAAGHPPKKTRPTSAYNMFVKQHSKGVRERLAAERKTVGNLQKVSQAEVMKECGRLWKERKESRNNK